MSGDQFSIRVSSWYRLNGITPSSPASPVADVLTNLIAGIGSLPGGTHPSISVLQANSPALSDNLMQFLSDTAGKTTDGRPMAFVNWVLFDNQFNYIPESSGFQQVGTDNEFKKHVLMNLPVTKSGYLYIYLSNETPDIKVFFDNLQVGHVRGPLLEESHYYPFGLVMAGISDKTLKKQYSPNKSKANGGSELQNEEFSDGSGWESYDALLRTYDPQIGRFNQQDPLVESEPSWTPYSFVLNNPISFIDPLGMDTTCPGCMPEVIVTPPPIPKPSPVTTPMADVTTGGAPAIPLAPVIEVPPAPVPPLRIVPPSPVVIPIRDPIPLVMPELVPAVGFTVILVAIPITGNTHWPFGDELYWRRTNFDPFADRSPKDREKDNSTITLYRGVYAGHPDIENARNGVAVPMNPLFGHNNARSHNAGDVNSIFTSWTVNKGIAADMAGRKGWGGIILTKTFRKWQIVLSPDKFTQGEVLIPGVVTGARVENAKPSR